MQQKSPPEGEGRKETDRVPGALPRILEVLRKNPRGVNIREIAEATKINRMSVAKYLEVLTALETVEVRAMGNAKLYYLSQLVPVTTFLKFTSKPFFVVNREGIIVQVNETLYSRYIAIPREEILGAPILRHVRDRMIDPVAWERAFERAMNGEECMLDVGDTYGGTVTWYSVTMMPIEFPDGSHGVIIIGDDITEKRRIMDALAEKEDTFHRSFEALAGTFPGLLLISPKTYRIEYMNERLIRERGRDSTGDTCHRAFFGLDTPCPGCVASRVESGERVVRTMKSRKERRPYPVTSIPVTHNDGTVSVMVIVGEDKHRPQESGSPPPE